MRRALLLVFFFCAAAPVFFCAAAPDWAAPPAAPQQPDSYYLYNGAALRVVRGDPARAPYKRWQVWLYPQSLSASQYGGAALAYARWGVIQGSSARAVIEQLAPGRNSSAPMRISSGRTRGGGSPFPMPWNRLPWPKARRLSPLTCSQRLTL